jgi:hypothetical protein
MLAWETGPLLPIYRWFDRNCGRPGPQRERSGPATSCGTSWGSSTQRIVLDFTDHLTDREFYSLIYRDIALPREEDRQWAPTTSTGMRPGGRGSGGVARYYASDAERDAWAEMYRQPLPVRCRPAFPATAPRTGLSGSYGLTTADLYVAVGHGSVIALGLIGPAGTRGARRRRAWPATSDSRGSLAR